MKCPFCDEEMEHGFASSARSIVWKPKEKLDFFDRHIVAAPDEERLSWGITGSAQLEGYRCKNCKQVILKYVSKIELLAFLLAARVLWAYIELRKSGARQMCLTPGQTPRGRQ
jgi:hypothetical protein